MASLEPYYLGFASRVRNARIRAGMSQDDLAKRLGVTRPSVSNIESGRQRVLAHTACAIADITGVEREELLSPEPSVRRDPRWPTVAHELADKLGWTLERATALLAEANL